MIYLKNISGNIKQLYLHEFQIDEILEIDNSWYNESVIQEINVRNFQIYYNQIPIVKIIDQLDYLKGNGPVNVNINNQLTLSPFASKEIGDYKIYKRIHGIKEDVVIGENIILFTIPYQWVKITGMEIINAENLETASLYVLDSTTGTYSQIPNYILNQFAFELNMSKDYYKHKSEFDADLYQGMQIKVLYTSKSEKTIGINFILNEVKT